MSRSSVMPVVGNLAWAPMPSVDRVDILDRFNGVPTLGVVAGNAGSHLFWRVAGHTHEHITCWLYVPLGASEESHLADCEDVTLLDGLVFQAAKERWVTVAAAWDNRILFEREWQLPAALDPVQFTAAYFQHLAECLEVAAEQDLPASRLEMMRKASVAVHQMANA